MAGHSPNCRNAQSRSSIINSGAALLVDGGEFDVDVAGGEIMGRGRGVVKVLARRKVRVAL